MRRWLEKLEPEASEELRIAVNAQHLYRWRIARADYPVGRSGYLAWRTACAAMHAELTAAILTESGYAAETVLRISDLIQKKRLELDPEAQCLEDVACLVFLEHDLERFSRTQPPHKAAAVLNKTLRKMSPRGRAAAAELGTGPVE